MDERWYFVYILTNSSRRPLYVGVTNSIVRRTGEHYFEPATNSYTEQYKLNRLVYFERFRRIGDAIAREKQLKRWSHSKKAALVESFNPKWNDLAAAWFATPGPSTASLRGSARDDSGLVLRRRSLEEMEAEVVRKRELLKDKMRQLRKISRKRRVPPLGPEGPRSG